MPTEIKTYEIEMLWDCTQCKAQNRGRDKVCKNCTNPLDGSEEFYMPDDTSRRAEIHDSDLLNQANAGPDWECRFCKSHQRRDDGKCANCTADQSFSQGTDYNDQRDTAAPTTRPETPTARRSTAAPVSYSIPQTKKPLVKYGLIGTGFVGLILFLVWLFAPKKLNAPVSDVYFQHVVHIDRYRVYDGQGFDPEPGAFDIEDRGTRIHHHDRVLDGYDTVYYSEEVKDGESCTTTPKVCKKSGCTSQKNGFARCGETCSGGDKVCTPKYHSEPRSRKVARYKDVPVYQPYYAWHVWKWGHIRDAFATGHTIETWWPSEDEIALCRTCSAGEQERTTRAASYQVTFSHEKDTWKYEPKTLDEFKKFPKGSVHHLKITLGFVSVEKAK